MVYLPEYRVSIVVMINAFPNKCATAITKGLIKAVLKDLDAFGIPQYILHYFDYNRFVLTAIISIAIWILVIIYHIRKKRKLLQHK
jgi:hypothetical protein